MSALKYADRVGESTVSTGPGDIGLAGPISTDHASFASQFADGDEMPVVVFGGGKWMSFVGRYNSGANSLTRVTFRRSSTGSNLSLSGTMTVLCGWGADDAEAGIRTDVDQTLSAAQQAQVRANIGAFGGGSVTSSLGADVTLNNSAAFFEGPSVAQGSVGSWFAVGSVTLQDSVGQTGYDVKLWDGTTVIASTSTRSVAAGVPVGVTLGGLIATPAGNIRMSVRPSRPTSTMFCNASGQGKDSMISALRIA